MTHKATIAALTGLILCAACATTPNVPGLPPQWAGPWTLQKDLGAPGITALSDEEAKALLGQTITITQPRALGLREACELPSFRVSTQTIAGFLADYNLTPAQLPLAGPTVELLDIKCQRSVTWQLARLQNGCTLLPRDGHFFQLSGSAAPCLTKP
jgi:hypothetical protein